MNDIQLLYGQRIWLRTLTGTVIDSNRSSELSIDQTGNRVNARGDIIPGEVSSRTTSTQEIWLRLADGSERACSLVDLGIPVRAGHVVSLVYGAAAGQKSGQYFGAFNHNSGDLRCDVTEQRVFRLWKLNVGANADILTWGATGGVLVALLGYVKGGASRADKTAIAMFGAIAGLFVGVGLYIYVGSAFTSRRRGQAITEQINGVATGLLRAERSI